MRISLFFISPIFLLSFSSSLAQPKSGAISVKVIDLGTNKPITFGTVEVMNFSPPKKSSGLRRSARVMINGNINPVLIKGLAAGGDYRVHARATGLYSDGYDNHVWVSAGQTSYITIYLYRKNGPIPKPPPPPGDLPSRRMKKK